jgi:hypothetical protein
MRNRLRGDARFCQATSSVSTMDGSGNLAAIILHHS